MCPDEFSQRPPDERERGAPEPAEYYVEDGLLVFTAAHHVKRGRCCGSGCRHCPYEPRHVEGTTQVSR